MIAPILEKVTAEPNASGTGLPLDLVKLDTDQEDGGRLAQKFEVCVVTFTNRLFHP
mgnify:CR=1 FL=1